MLPFYGVTAIVFHIVFVCLLPEVCSMQYTCAILSSVACPALQYFPTSHKVHEIRKEFIEPKICLDFLYKISKTLTGTHEGG